MSDTFQHETIRAVSRRLIPYLCRDAMRRMAATVMVLSTGCAGRRLGLTVSSLMSLSMEPPVLCFGVNRRSAFCAAAAEVGWVCVNVLAYDQEDIGRVFSSTPGGEQRFATGDWANWPAEESGRGGPVLVPYLRGAQSNIFAKIMETAVCGTHVLYLANVRFIGEVSRKPPLLYAGGSYRKIDRDQEIPAHSM